MPTWTRAPAPPPPPQGHHKCDPSLLVGRPRSHAELSSLVRALPRARAAGVGHSWWAGQMCAGANASAATIVTTEFEDVLRA